MISPGIWRWARPDDGLIEDAFGLVYLHHAVVVDAEAQQGSKSHKKERVVFL